MTWVYVALVALAVQLATLATAALLVRRALRPLAPMLAAFRPRAATPITSATGANDAGL